MTGEVMNLPWRDFQMEAPWDKDDGTAASTQALLLCPDSWETCLAAHYCSLPYTATSSQLL